MTWTAKELGIDLDKLETERFYHRKQIQNHLEHNKRADAFWRVPVNVRDTPANPQDLKTTRL